MPVRSGKMIPSTASRVLIQITEFTQEMMCGILFCPYTGQSRHFVDVLDFTTKLDALFDEIAFPLAATNYRAFTPTARQKHANAAKQSQGLEVMQVPDEKLDENTRNTFVVHVQFRRNATWQGTVKWAAQNQERHFRSTLELLKIMDSAINASGLKEE